MQYLIATTFEVVHYKPLQEVHLSRYNQIRRGPHRNHGQRRPKPGHTHRSPSIIPFDASYDPILNQVVVSYNSTVESTVSLSNLMTGENSTTYGTTSLVILPVPSDGTYLLEITLANGREYYGTFDAVSE